MLIRGFSEHTTYICADCHLKCCATEYNLPLLGSEKLHLSQKYPEYQSYFHSTKEGDKLLRGNSCPFLEKTGHCQLHTTSLKPITCQIYPLLMWRFNQNDILVSIHPCRGKGFRWYSAKINKIPNSYIEQLLVDAHEFFETYLGEEIDKNNPYGSISPSRVKKQLKYYNHTSQDQLFAKTIYDITSTSSSQFFPSFQEKTTELMENEVLKKYLNSVLNWLIWSPVGLQLSIENAQMLFSIAAFWLIEQTDLNINDNISFLSDSNYMEQLSSFYARAILPSFWYDITTQSTNKRLISFANQAYLVLTGKLPQEHLIQFLSS